MKNTYGDRLRKCRCTRRQRLEGVSEQALTNNSMVLIAAFSIGRTQEPLYELEEITRMPFAGASKGHARKTAINPIVPIRAGDWSGGGPMSKIATSRDQLARTPCRPRFALPSPALVSRFTRVNRDLKSSGVAKGLE